MSNSVRPHRRQPTRLPHPWDFLGKNTGVGCHCLLRRWRGGVLSLLKYLKTISRVCGSVFSKFQGEGGFPGGSNGKESAYSAGDPGSIPGSRRCLGEGNGNPLQSSCLENPRDRGAWLGKGQQDVEILPPSGTLWTCKNVAKGFVQVRFCNGITNTGRGPTSLYGSWQRKETREGRKQT